MRTVVPVLQGICYGCFMAVPTAWASEVERNARIDVCQNCGRFLYHVG
jgi:predicted  nucleic acid-binding Zn-ribbon protein